MPTSRPGGEKTRKAVNPGGEFFYLQENRAGFADPVTAVCPSGQMAKRFGASCVTRGLVSKAKTDPKTVQGLLRHANIKTTLQLYARADRDETRAAQGAFLTAVGVETVQ